jgi:hypothetical protein
MQHTATRAIEVRLNLWKTFFEMGTDGTPPGATNAEYDYEVLIDLARDNGDTGLTDLADVVELMAHNHIAGMNDREAEILMLDDSPEAPANGVHHATRVCVTMAELDAALVGI